MERKRLPLIDVIWVRTEWDHRAGLLLVQSFVMPSFCIPADFDPSLGMMTGIAPMNPMMPGLGIVPAQVSQDMPIVKEIIHCKSCTLFPPNPSESFSDPLLGKSHEILISKMSNVTF